MSEITCPHCAQPFNNYRDGIKASKCPRCGGEISYYQGDTYVDKNILIKHFWKIVIVSSILGMIMGIKDNMEWYEVIALMIFFPIGFVLLLYFLSTTSSEHPMKK